MQNETEVVTGKKAAALRTFLVAETRRKSGNKGNKRGLVLKQFFSTDGAQEEAPMGCETKI